MADDIGGQFQELSGDTVENQVPLIALEPDFLQIPGQKFAVLSFIDRAQYQGLRMEGSLSHPMHLIKVRGIFASQEAAEKHVKQCQSMDTYFDYHIVECHKWTTVGASRGDEQEWQDNDVNDAMQEYFQADNDTLANLTERIKLSQEGSERSDDTTKFWRESQKAKSKEDAAPTLPPNLTQMSLKDAAGLAASIPVQ